MKKTDPLAAAKETLAGFTTERDRVQGRIADIGREREQIAHSALTGNATSREKLEALKKEAAELDDHRKDVEAAIGQAERDVAAAKAALLRKEQVAAAERRKGVATSLRAAGERADRGAREFAEALAEIEAITRDPDASGIALINFFNLRVLLAEAGRTAFQPIQRLMLPEDRHPIAPSARRTFGELLGDKADRIDADADRVIAGEQETSQEAA